MLHSTRMVEAWQQADNFNRTIAIGSIVLHDGKTHKVKDVSYVLPSGQVVVLLESSNSPVPLSSLLLPS